MTFKFGKMRQGRKIIHPIQKNLTQKVVRLMLKHHSQKAFGIKGKGIHIPVKTGDLDFGMPLDLSAQVIDTQTTFPAFDHLV